MSTLLKVDNVVKNFSGLTAVSNVSMYLDTNELVALIGPNGAGKTTLFNLLTGVIPVSSGSIVLNGDNGTYPLNGKPAYKIAKMGLSRTFQNIRLFKELTVMDNVLIAMTSKVKEGFIPTIFRFPSYYKTEAKLTEKAKQLLEIFELENDVDVLAKTSLTEPSEN